jgi:hypothetical protein
MVEHDMVVEEREKWILLLCRNMEYDLLLCFGILIFCLALAEQAGDEFGGWKE